MKKSPSGDFFIWCSRGCPLGIRVGIEARLRFPRARRGEGRNPIVGTDPVRVDILEYNKSHEKQHTHDTRKRHTLLYPLHNLLQYHHRKNNHQFFYFRFSAELRNPFYFNLYESQNVCRSFPSSQIPSLETPRDSIHLVLRRLSLCLSLPFPCNINL